MVFDPQLDGSFKGACLNAEAVQKMMRKETAAGRLGEDYVLLRLNGDKSDHFRRSEAVEFGDGVQLVYGMYGDELYIRMTPVFVYSVQDQIYMYSNEPAEIFSDTAKVWAKGDITANIGYDGENLSLENIEIPGEYVDPMSLT